MTTEPRTWRTHPVPGIRDGTTKIDEYFDKILIEIIDHPCEPRVRGFETGPDLGVCI